MSDSPLNRTSPTSRTSDIRALLESAPHIDDAGFSDRVVRALPRRSRAVTSSYAIVPAFTVVACALAYGLGSHGPVAQPAQATHHALALLMTTSFLGIALALLLVAMGAMLTAEE